MAALFPKKSEVSLQMIPWMVEVSYKVEARVQAIWKGESLKRPLYDGMVLCLSSHDERAITCFSVPYRYLLAQMKDRKLRRDLHLYPLGVSGVVTDGSCVLIGKRSNTVSSYKHYFECVPSGSLDGNQDPKRQLLQELSEEAGICADDVSTITYIGLFYSSKDHCYDLGYLLSLHSAASTVQSSAEYTQLAWMTSLQVSELLHSRRRIVPLSKQLLSLLFS